MGAQTEGLAQGEVLFSRKYPNRRLSSFSTTLSMCSGMGRAFSRISLGMSTENWSSISSFPLMPSQPLMMATKTLTTLLVVRKYSLIFYDYVIYYLSRVFYVSVLLMEPVWPQWRPTEACFVNCENGKERKEEKLSA